MRTRVALGFVAAHIVLLGAVAGTAAVVEGGATLAWGAAALGETVAMAWGAVYAMRGRNRRALEQLAERGENLPGVAPAAGLPACATGSGTGRRRQTV